MNQCNVKRYMPHLLEHIRAGRIDAKAIITHRFPLEDAPDAYRHLREQEGRLHQVRADAGGGLKKRQQRGKDAKTTRQKDTGLGHRFALRGSSRRTDGERAQAGVARPLDRAATTKSDVAILTRAPMLPPHSGVRHRAAAAWHFGPGAPPRLHLARASRESLAAPDDSRSDRRPRERHPRIGERLISTARWRATGTRRRRCEKGASVLRGRGARRASEAPSCDRRWRSPCARRGR